MKSASTFLLLLTILLSFSVAGSTQESEQEETLTITREELREIVEESVAARLRPLSREISELKEETRLHDIMGGIGVIMGMGGLAFYFLGIKKKEDNKRQ